MTIINICFNDGTPEKAQKAAEGLNMYAGVSETWVYSSAPDGNAELRRQMGESRTICEKSADSDFEQLRIRMTTDINDAKRRCRSESKDNPKFLINLSTANNIESFVCGLVAISMGAEVYTPEGQKISMSALPDIGSIDRTKRRILGILFEGGHMTTMDICGRLSDIQYRTVRKALDRLEKDRLVCQVHGENKNDGKRGPKSLVYEITESGRIVLMLTVPENDEQTD